MGITGCGYGYVVCNSREQRAGLKTRRWAERHTIETTTRDTVVGARAGGIKNILCGPRRVPARRRLPPPARPPVVPAVPPSVPGPASPLPLAVLSIPLPPLVVLVQALSFHLYIAHLSHPPCLLPPPHLPPFSPQQRPRPPNGPRTTSSLPNLLGYTVQAQDAFSFGRPPRSSCAHTCHCHPNHPGAIDQPSRFALLPPLGSKARAQPQPPFNPPFHHIHTPL